MLLLLLLLLSTRKADRGMNKSLSKTILRRTGIFIRAGSGML